MMEFQRNGLSVRPAEPGTPVSEKARSFGAKRFRYSYLYRLIDDGELQGLPAAARAELRRAHKQVYWKNLSLLRRDANRVLKARRARMAAEANWDFQTLVSDYARVQTLLATLTLAGVSHASRVPAVMSHVRAACAEFELMFSLSPAAAAV